jgi:hypothetical protein
MDKVFDESYVHACESLARGYQTPGVREIIYQLTDKSGSFNARYRSALYKMRANEREFTDDDMIVLHELLVYSTIEMMRAIHTGSYEPAKSEPMNLYGIARPDAAYQPVPDQVSFLSMLAGFGAEGASNGRVYSACGLGIAPGETPGSSRNPQSPFGGNAENGEVTTKDEDKYGSLEFDCPKCKQTNRRPRNKLIPNCQKCGTDVTCA